MLRQRIGRRAGAWRVAFADALKEEVANATGHSVEYIEEHKSQFRSLLQAWGVMRRETGGDSYWIDKVREPVLDIENFGGIPIICDVRFQNEADWILAAGGILVRVVRPNHDGGAGSHVSETQLEGLQCHHTLVAVDLTELSEEVDRLLTLVDI